MQNSNWTTLVSQTGEKRPDNSLADRLCNKAFTYISDLVLLVTIWYVWYQVCSDKDAKEKGSTD